VALSMTRRGLLPAAHEELAQPPCRDGGVALGIRDAHALGDRGQAVSRNVAGDGGHPTPRVELHPWEIRARATAAASWILPALRPARERPDHGDPATW
jgi:hypothetical protein